MYEFNAISQRFLQEIERKKRGKKLTRLIIIIICQQLFGASVMALYLFNLMSFVHFTLLLLANTL